VKSPLTGGIVPLSTFVEIDSSRAGPLQVTHQSQFPSVTLTFNLRAGVALGEAVDAITAAAAELGMPPQVIASFQGDAQAFQASLSSMPVLVLAALVVVYIILGILYESFIHPLTILSTLPSAGIGALLALRFGQMELSVIGIIGIILLIGIVKKNGIMTSRNKRRLDIIHVSFRVMEDHAERISLAAAQPAHAVTHVDAIDVLHPPHRAVTHREDHGFALTQRRHLGARLHPRTLLRQHELAAGEIPARLGKQDSCLQREHVLAVEVLVQAIEVAGAISQQQRRRPPLAGCLATVEIGRVRRRITLVDPEQLVPGIGDRRQRPVEGRAQGRDQFRQRIGEVLVFALSKAVPRHDHAAAERRVLRISLNERSALFRREQRPGGGATTGGKVIADARPVEPPDARRKRIGQCRRRACAQVCQRAHARASFASSASLRSMPQR
jgi:AcrB/AcrD/AcrF family